jgi:hypothetical protein
MLPLNKRLQELYLKPLQKWKVASKSEKGVYHIVEELPSGKLVCSCTAGQMNKECRHKRLVKNNQSKFFKPNYGKSN